MKILVIIVVLIISVLFLINQNKPMSIIQNSSVYNTGSSTGDTYTISGYNPAYPGTEKGRIVFVSFRSFSGVGQAAVVSVTYGGVPMRFASGHLINNGVTSIAIFFIINPPSGAQDIVFTSIAAPYTIKVGIVSYYSDSDFSFRIGDIATGISGSAATSLTTTVTTTYENSWSIGLTTAPVNQTLTSGTFAVGDANPGQLMVVDSNGAVPLGTATGVGVTTGSGVTIMQEVCTFLPIRRGFFNFIDI